jgi:hypothetical protein
MSRNILQLTQRRNMQTVGRMDVVKIDGFFASTRNWLKILLSFVFISYSKTKIRVLILRFQTGICISSYLHSAGN